ncbi:hypothetical protein DPMN_009433 [Dreissena polymorpha]|uniref:Uncharacterized protein n=1 Tax=Dreissena polymorpha TaxID=45954 RepID=A0A9D4N183_DREPO|nr:hypothetical protein DPMN_009433 [Dreissena polymorpha]
MLTVLCDSLHKTVICWPSNKAKQTVIDEFQNKKASLESWGAKDGTHKNILHQGNGLQTTSIEKDTIQ